MVLRPELAERWEVSPDAKVFTFHLRNGVKFANVPPVNGRDLTSADVKWSAEHWARAGEFKDKNLPQGRLEFMYEGLDRIETPDPRTARFYFKEPFSPFISYAASDWNPVVPREIYEKDGHFKDTIVGSGPFQLDVQASQKGTRWVWKKNAGYWDEGKPYLDELRQLVLKEDNTAFAAFQAKQIDALDALFFQDMPGLMKGTPNAKTFKYLQPHAAYLRMGQAPGRVVNDVRVRRAVSLALDRDEINKVFAGSDGSWALVGAIAGLFSDAEIKQMFKHDPVEAKRLLAEAGYPNGVTLELPTDNARTQNEVTLYQLMQAQLKKVGMNVDWQIMDTTQQRQRRRAGAYDLDSSTNLAPLEADGDSILYAEYHSSLHRSTNNSKINDPELDRLLEAQRREPLAEKRKELQRNAAKRIVDMMWAAPLVYPPRWDATQAHVMNYYPHLSVHAPHLVSWLQK